MINDDVVTAKIIVSSPWPLAGSRSHSSSTLLLLPLPLQSKRGPGNNNVLEFLSVRPDFFRLFKIDPGFLTLEGDDRKAIRLSAPS
jgi:hypothetical protein